MAAETCTRLKIRVELDGSSREEFVRRVAAHEPLQVVLNWLEEAGYQSVAEELRNGTETVSLVDDTTYPPRVLSTWSSTLQGCGLWPSATLVVRSAACFELQVKTTVASDGVATIWVRPDERWSEIAARAFAALPTALPSVKAAKARHCRLAYAGNLLEADGTPLSSRMPRRGAIVILCSPAPKFDEDPPQPARVVATCRICYQDDEVVTSWVPNDENELSRISEELMRVVRGEVSWKEMWSSLGSQRRAENRLISPCRCAGSMKYVHIGCLNRWRATAPTARSRFKCDQCGYAYRVRRTALAAFLASDVGALSVAVCLLAVAVQTLGFSLMGVLSANAKKTLFDSLGVRPVSRAAQIACLGSGGVGLLCFALYAFDILVTAYRHHRLGIHFTVAAEPAVVLLLMIAAEIHDLK